MQTIANVTKEAEVGKRNRVDKISVIGVQRFNATLICNN